MPKVIFRPNPTPPPFVPPVPSYDDTLYIKVNPFDFEIGESVNVNIQPGNFPTFDYVTIYGGNEYLGADDTIFPTDFTPEQFGINVQVDAIYSKSTFQYFTASFSLSDGSVYDCNIVFQEF